MYLHIYTHIYIREYILSKDPLFQGFFFLHFNWTLFNFCCKDTSPVSLTCLPVFRRRTGWLQTRRWRWSTWPFKWSARTAIHLLCPYNYVAFDATISPWHHPLSITPTHCWWQLFSLNNQGLHKKRGLTPSLVDDAFLQFFGSPPLFDYAFALLTRTHGHNTNSNFGLRF